MDTWGILGMYATGMIIAFFVSTMMIFTCGWSCYIEVYKGLLWISSVGIIALIATESIEF